MKGVRIICSWTDADIMTRAIDCFDIDLTKKELDQAFNNLYNCSHDGFNMESIDAEIEHIIREREEREKEESQESIIQKAVREADKNFMEQYGRKELILDAINLINRFEDIENALGVELTDIVIDDLLCGLNGLIGR